MKIKTTDMDDIKKKLKRKSKKKKLKIYTFIFPDAWWSFIRSSRISEEESEK